jgi:uncharacterized protein
MILRVILSTVLLMLVSCSEAKSGAGPAVNTRQRAVIQSVASKTVVQALERAVQSAVQLEASVATWNGAPSALENEQSLAAARAAFEATFLAWQAVEVFQFGPLGSATRVTAGKGFRDEVYSWPTTNFCRVDAALVAGTAPDDAYFDTALVTSKGLAVIEYLLFGPELESSCPAEATILTDGSWAALAANGTIASRRKAWANGAARHVARTIKKTQSEWVSPDGFASKIAQAGEMGSAWRTPKDALDEIFAGVFYVDRYVKDFKLAAPSGISATCLEVSCPKLAESPYAKLSSRALYENLQALRLVFEGSSPDEPGFNGLLLEAGADALAQEMRDSLSAAIEDAQKLELPVQRLVVEDNARAANLHGRVKTFTDFLKTQFVTTLSLKVPKEGAGDND